MRLFICGIVFFSIIASVYSQCQCGIESLKTRVVNGRATKLNQYPWMVNLLISEDGKGWGSCGSTIINNYWILTASHCFEPASTGFKWDKPESLDWSKRPLNHQVYISFGAQKKESMTEMFSKGKNMVDKIVIHPEYARGSKPMGFFNNDIALIKLKTPISFDSTKSPICLGGWKGEKDGFLSGWGKQTNSTGNAVRAEEMHEVDLQFYKCENAEHFLCAKGVRHGAGRGDSGGPLSIRRDGTVIQVGVVSHGDSEEKIHLGTHFTDKYTMVDKHKDWIKKVTEGSSFCSKSFS